MSATLSIIATIISSVALIGVAIGLILQSRQLRANQLQVMRGLQLELIKMGIDNPEADPFMAEANDKREAMRAIHLNLWLKYLETCYSFGTMSKTSVGSHVARFFSSEHSRSWWATAAREVYEVDAATKKQKEFFAIVDSALQDATRVPGSPDDPGAKSVGR